jgi:predicted porin
MNKKLLTLAVAAALAAPGLASAEAIMYGKLHVSLDWADVTNVVRPLVDADGLLVENSDGTPRQLGVDWSGWGMANGYIPGERRASRLGVKGSEDLGNGLKAIYQIEFGINATDTNNNVLSNSDTISYRNTFVGLAGDWGTVLAGRHDTPMKISTGKLDLFGDTMADYNGTVGFRDLRADNTVTYISPNWSGIQFAGSIIPAGGATGGGQGLNVNENELAGAYSLALIYSNGPFYGSVAFESLGNEHFNSQNVSLFANNCPIEVPNAANRGPNDPFASACAFQDEDAQAWRIGLGLLDWNGFTLTGIYEDRDEFFSDSFVAFTDPTDSTANFFLPLAGPDKSKSWQIQAAYAFGNLKFKGMYGQANYEGSYSYGGNPGAFLVNYANDLYEGDRETWALGVDYNFSKRTTAYVLYTQVTDDLSGLPVFSTNTNLPGLPSNATATNGAAGRTSNMRTSDWDGFSIGLMHSF